MKFDVFISHSTKDRKAADAACHYLERRGIKCWMAPRDVVSGSDWAESIVKAIRECRLMLLIFSSHANDSGHIKREVNIAGGRNIPIVPFRIEDVPMSASLSYFLEAAHWLDAILPPVEQHFERLATNVNVLLGREEVQWVPDLVMSNPQDDLLEKDQAEETQEDLPKDEASDTAEAESLVADPSGIAEPVADTKVSEAKEEDASTNEPEDKDNKVGPEILSTSIIPDTGNEPYGWPIILGVTVLVIGIATLGKLSLDSGSGDSNVNGRSANTIVTPLPPTPTPPVTRDPASTAAEHITKGKECVERKDLDCAVSEFTKAINLDNTNDDTFNRRGNVYTDRKEYQMALGDYNECIRLDPNDHVCFYNRAIVFKAQGRFDEAIADYTKTIELKPDYAFAYNNRGNIYLAQKNLYLALWDFEKAVELKPDDSMYKANLESARKEIESSRGKANIK